MQLAKCFAFNSDNTTFEFPELLLLICVSAYEFLMLQNIGKRVKLQLQTNTRPSQKCLIKVKAESGRDGKILHNIDTFVYVHVYMFIQFSVFMCTNYEKL